MVRKEEDAKIGGEVTLAIVFVTNPKNSNVVPKNEVIMLPSSTIVTFESSSYNRKKAHHSVIPNPKCSYFNRVGRKKEKQNKDSPN